MSSSRMIKANGIELFIREQGQGPLVVLCHGWPELSYSWRHQIPALADAGFHVVAPDMRGYGQSAAPLDLLRQGGITNFYWQYFQTPGVAEAELERDVARTMRIVLGGRGLADPSAAMFVQEGKGFLGHATAEEPLPAWLSEADLAYFTESFRKCGFRGGLNWYRHNARNLEL